MENVEAGTELTGGELKEVFDKFAASWHARADGKAIAGSSATQKAIGGAPEAPEEAEVVD